MKLLASDFDGTLFTQLTEYKNKLIANNGQEIVESTNGKVKTIKYKKQLDAYSSDLESFEYNNQLFWFTHGGVSGVYNSYLFCYDTCWINSNTCCKIFAKYCKF